MLGARVGSSWAVLRGVVAVVGMSACSGTTAGTGPITGPASPAQKQDVSGLQGDWDLVSLYETGGAVTPLPRGRFAAGFGADGDLFIQADCNVCSAGFVARADGSLEVKGPIPCTLAYCTSAPLDTRYLTLLESGRTWSIGDGTLEVVSTGGVLLFERSGG